MANKESQNSTNGVKSGTSVLSIVFAGLFFIGGILCFISDSKFYEGIDLGPSAGVTGWYLMGIGMLLSLIGLALIMKMPNPKQAIK